MGSCMLVLGHAGVPGSGAQLLGALNRASEDCRNVLLWDIWWQQMNRLFDVPHRRQHAGC